MRVKGYRDPGTQKRGSCCPLVLRGDKCEHGLGKNMANETTEQRRYPRLPFPAKQVVSLKGTGSANSYRCRDWGLGGMLIECPEPLAIGSTVRFAVGVGGETVRGLAAVRRTAPCAMGIAFTSLNMDDRAKLRTFLDGLAARLEPSTPTTI